MNITTSDIIDGLYNNYTHNYFRIDGQYVFNWESDFFMLTQSEYAIEIEIKVSRSDYQADFKKKHKHRLMAAGKPIAVKTGHCYGGMSFSVNQAEKWKDRTPPGLAGRPEHSKIKFIKPQNNVPNRFYFCCPEGLLSESDIPEYAGLLHAQIDVRGRVCVNKVKRAPAIHRNKFTNYKKIAQRLDMNTQRMRWKLNEAEMKLERYRKHKGVFL